MLVIIVIMHSENRPCIALVSD